MNWLISSLWTELISSVWNKLISSWYWTNLVFHYSSLPWPLTSDLWIKIYFWFWLRFRRVIRIFLGIILHRVNLPAVSYCTESISLQYHTAQSQSPRSIILCSVNLPAVSYCAESISPQCHTAQSHSPRSIILRTAQSQSPRSIILQCQSPRSIILRSVNLPAVSYCARSISPQYLTAQSQSPPSIILRGVSLLDTKIRKNSVKS